MSSNKNATDGGSYEEFLKLLNVNKASDLGSKAGPVGDGVVVRDVPSEEETTPNAPRASHLSLAVPKTPRAIEEDELYILSPELANISSRDVVLKAEKINQEAGHENNGYLSFSHGFAPRITPMTHFPPDFELWNDLVIKTPELLSSNRLRQYCDDLPVLDAKKLPPEFALRAANVLGYTAHAYWNLWHAPKQGKLPPGLEVPWKVINSFHLGRKGAPYLGFFELIVGNFQFEEGKVPSPLVAEVCPWATKELAIYGSVEYNPLEATIEHFHPSFWLTKLKEERIFYGVMTEMHTIGAPLVKLTVQAQEAVLSGDTAKLKQILSSLLDLLTTLTFKTFNKIQQQRMATHYQDATIWAKVVAPVATPITSTTFGPSGTAAPIVHLLDALFGRIKHEQFIGKEVKGLFHSFPPNWKNFILSVWNGPSIRNYVSRSNDIELQGMFGAALRQYAGDNGFLGRHKLKMVGYLEIAMKLGRAVTLGGFAGMLTDRTWDKISDELKVGQDERFAGISTNAIFNVGKVVCLGDDFVRHPSRQEHAHHVRVNIEGTGINYEVGSHVGILYESSAQEVFVTLLAFAKGNATEATRLGEEFMVKLSPSWKRALQARQEYHSAEPPSHLKLKDFLKYGTLRPASRKMLKIAHEWSLSRDILAMLNEGLESAVTFSDIVTILGREGIDLLATENVKPSLRRRLVNTIASNRRSALMGISQKEGRRRSSIYTSSIYTTYDICDIVDPCGLRLYSIASSPIVHPNEIHLYIQHVQYDTKSAVATTSPLLGHTHPLVRQKGAASDYLVSKSIPRYQLAINALYEEIGNQEDAKVNLESRVLLKVKNAAEISDTEFEAIKNYASECAEEDRLDLKTAIKAFEHELKDKPDPRNMSIVLVCNSSPRFRLPDANQPSPCIMIAGGTGLAPFRSFWQSLATAGKLQNSQQHLLLIQQRTRHSMAFEGEISSLVQAGLLDVEVMFSRDECLPVFEGGGVRYQDAPGRKGYIDQVILDTNMQTRIASMIRDYNGHVYLCGRGGLAKTAVDALDLCLCNIYGEAAGKLSLEKMVAENRLVLDIFTSLSAPIIRRRMELSELCQCNDFAGLRGKNSGVSKPLYLVINSVVYDMKNLLRLHPGGDALLKLYCGMDATKAWEAVQHHNAPEVSAMLEMFDTKMLLRDVTPGLSIQEQLWYESGWKKMTMLLVEIQNSLTLAFEKHWDEGDFSSIERDLGHHFVVWEGEAFWRPKRSMLKGSFFADTHDRFWSMFLPMLLGDAFDELKDIPRTEGVDEGAFASAGYAEHHEMFQPEGTPDHFFNIINIMIEDMKCSQSHHTCDTINLLLKGELGGTGELFVPGELQAYMEEVRKVDEDLLEDIKARLVCGLRVFEVSSKVQIYASLDTFHQSIKGIVEDIAMYLDKLSSLTIAAFGFDHVQTIATDPGFKRGGLTLLHSRTIETVERQYVDKEEATIKVLGADVDIGHKDILE